MRQSLYIPIGFGVMLLIGMARQGFSQDSAMKTAVPLPVVTPPTFHGDIRATGLSPQMFRNITLTDAQVDSLGRLAISLRKLRKLVDTRLAAAAGDTSRMTDSLRKSINVQRIAFIEQERELYRAVLDSAQRGQFDQSTAAVFRLWLQQGAKKVQDSSKTIHS